MSRLGDAGRMMCGDTATIYDVAKAAGVSPTTVSHVVNGTRNVSESMRRRVDAAIIRLGYHPNDAARMLREGRAKLIGVILPDISNPFFSRLIYHLEMLAFEIGARIVSCNSDYDLVRESAYLGDLMRRRVDGIIIAPVQPSLALQERLRATRLPVVVIDRVSDALSIPTVAIDNAAGAALAARHLYSLGHRRIGCITATPGRVESVDVRTNGFLQMLADLGVPPPAIRYSDFKVAGGLEAAEDLLAAESDLTAVFCTNDAMAAGALRAAAQAGRLVPDSLSVMGFDDSLEALLCQPQLTTIGQPIEALAEAAMGLLRADAAQPARVRLQAQLVMRESTAAPSLGGVLRPLARPRVIQARQPRRIVVAGADATARRHARLLQRTQGAVLAGVYDTVPLRAAELAHEFDASRVDDLDQALARGDVDGVIVSGPVPFRAQTILCAAGYQVGVLAAVPWATTAAGLGRLAEATLQNTAVLQASLPLGFDLGILELASQVRAGRVGPLGSLRIVCRGGLAQTGLFDQLDLLALLANEAVAEVAGFGSESDALLLNVRFASGALASIDLSRAAPLGFKHRVEASGSLGELAVEVRPCHSVVFRGRDGAAGCASPLTQEPFAEAIARQLQAFIRTLSGELSGERLEGHPAALADVLATQRAIFAATETLATGRVVRLDAAAPVQSCSAAVSGG